MASLNSEVQDRGKLYKFTKILTLKVAQIVVQSRQGKKISHECNAMKPSDDGPPSSSHSLQWVIHLYDTNNYLPYYYNDIFYNFCLV